MKKRSFGERLLFRYRFIFSHYIKITSKGDFKINFVVILIKIN